MGASLKPGDDVLLRDSKGRSTPATVIEIIPATRARVPRVWVFLPALETCQKVSLYDLVPR